MSDGIIVAGVLVGAGLISLSERATRWFMNVALSLAALCGVLAVVAFIVGPK